MAGLKHETEDMELIRLITAYMEHLGKVSEYAAKKMPGRASFWLDVAKAPKEELRAYCKSCLASGEPGWQRMAKRNGWQPSQA